MKPNSPEDRLLDELLHEQSRAPDEAFLKQIETAVDAGQPHTVRRHVPRNFRKLALATGVGLAAAISFFFYLEKRDLRKSALAVREIQTAPRDESAEKEKAALVSEELSKAIREQEDKVEERRKVLASVVRTKGINYKGQDSSYGQPGVDEDQGASGRQEQLAMNEAREDGTKRGLESPNYASEAKPAPANKADVAFNWHSSPLDPRPRIVPAPGSVVTGGNAPAKSRAVGMGTFGRQSDFSRDIASEHVGGDRYGKFIDQPWKSPAQDPLSTFSIDVDTASYSNVRRMIQEGREIPKDAVRIEEFINAFKYSYAAPKSDGPFAVSATLAVCPWAPTHQLVRVAIKGREIESNKRPASNLVFLIDVSGSMQSPDKLPLLKQSMATLVEQLDERDRVAIVVYAGTEGVALPSTRLDAEGRATVLKALGKLEAGGSTNGGAGIKRAYELAMKEKSDGGVNRVILATDGDFNVGVTGKDSLVELVKERAKGGVFLTVLGFGTGNLNDAMMDAITRDGNGNYFYIDSEREGRKVFLQNLSGTLVTIAKDVKIQVEFNPAKVGSYRLIGYSNRVLRNEDFSNDKVDAGDIGAGHTVTAFYELTPPGTDGLKYQSAMPTPATTDEWLTVKLRHKHPEGDESRLIEFPLTGEVPALDKTDADFQFATAAALFGMKLRGMDEVKDIAWEKVLELAKPGLANDATEDRAEFVGLVRKIGGVVETDPAVHKVGNSEEADGPNVRTLRDKDGARLVFVRSPDGRVIEKKTFSKDGMLKLKITYKMDASGHPIGGKVFDHADHELFRLSYGYQKSSGMLVEERIFDSRVKRVDPINGKEVAVQRVIFTYDDHGKRSQPVVYHLVPGATLEEIFGIKTTVLDENPFAERVAPAPAEIAPENRR